jgi:hypothetical protein
MSWQCRGARYCVQRLSRGGKIHPTTTKFIARFTEQIARSAAYSEVGVGLPKPDVAGSIPASRSSLFKVPVTSPDSGPRRRSSPGRRPGARSRLAARKRHRRSTTQISASTRIAGKLRRHDLDRHLAVEPRIVAAIDLAHAAGPERRDDLVRAKSGPRRQHVQGSEINVPLVRTSIKISRLFFVPGDAGRNLSLRWVLLSGSVRDQKNGGHDGDSCTQRDPDPRIQKRDEPGRDYRDKEDDEGGLAPSRV